MIRADPMMVLRTMEWGIVPVLIKLVQGDDAWGVHAAADALFMFLQQSTGKTTEQILAADGLQTLCSAAAATTQSRGRQGSRESYHALVPFTAAVSLPFTSVCTTLHSCLIGNCHYLCMLHCCFIHTLSLLPSHTALRAC